MKRSRPGSPSTWRPLAHVALRNESMRSDIVDALHQHGWAAVESPTGYHLLQRLSGPLTGTEPWWRPELLVIDAYSPGCSGITIARGMTELGWTVPTVLVAANAEQHARLLGHQNERLFVTQPDLARVTVIEVARHCHRLGPIPPRRRAPGSPAAPSSQSACA